MASSKGFSLIETLVAVAIASIAILGLMQVVSHASFVSRNVLARFDTSMTMGLVGGHINNSSGDSRVSLDELMMRRYKIDHGAIRESLKTRLCDVQILSRERINFVVSKEPLYVQKVILKNGKDQQSFFRIVSDTQ